jgi:hypothetical protein
MGAANGLLTHRTSCILCWTRKLLGFIDILVGGLVPLMCGDSQL